MKLYKYLFYKLFAFSKAIGNGEVASEGNTWCNLIIFLGFNAVSIKMWIELLLNKKIPGGILDVALFILIGIFVYFKSIYRNRYFSYEKLFEGHSKTKRLIGTIVVSIYCIASIAIFFYMLKLYRARFF
jgi:hypothetical protein